MVAQNKWCDSSSVDSNCFTLLNNTNVIDCKSTSVGCMANFTNTNTMIPPKINKIASVPKPSVNIPQPITSTLNTKTINTKVKRPISTLNKFNDQSNIKSMSELIEAKKIIENQSQKANITTKSENNSTSKTVGSIMKNSTTINTKQNSNEQNNSVIQQKETELENKKVEVQEKEKQIENKKVEIDQKEKEIENKKAEVEQKEQLIQQKENLLQQKEKELQEKKQVIDQKEKIINEKPIEMKKIKSNNICCNDLTAECLACKENKSKDEYCATNMNVVGCSNQIKSNSQYSTLMILLILIIIVIIIMYIMNLR